MANHTVEGILAVDKPRGWTSHDVVARVRRLTGVRRAGHAGTLDPLATGVLLLCLGRATRVVSHLTGLEKEYRTRLRLGVATDTFDAEGQVVFRSERVPTDPDSVRVALEAFRGQIEQVPPMFSAVKVGGKRLYELARRGEVVDRAPRRVTVHAIEMEGLSGPDLDLRVVCSKGTYIRSMAEDLGKVLGCGAHVLTLRRTRVGAFLETSCRTLEQIAEDFGGGEISRSLLPTERALDHLPGVTLGDEGVRRFCSGAPVLLDPDSIAGCKGVEVQVSDSGGGLCGIGRLHPDGSLRAVTVLTDPLKDPGQGATPR